MRNYGPNMKDIVDLKGYITEGGVTHCLMSMS